MSHTPEFDISQITEFVYLGTNLNHLETSHMEILKNIGITAEIDLENERQKQAPGVDVYLWLPVENYTAPTHEQLEAGVTLIDLMEKHKKKVYVHCALGHGRSPTLVAAYLISKGKSVEDAIETIKAARPEIHLEEVQLTALRAYQNN